MNQEETPLYDSLIQFAEQRPISFHVPGHKHGALFHNEDILRCAAYLDQTELSGLDDLHAPEGIIAKAQQLAAAYFGAKHSRFLVGGSTVGNLAMILGTIQQDEAVLVQRNCHKSILNGLELAGAKPVFLAPEYNEAKARYTHPTPHTVYDAIKMYPEAKALILTYPDYYGTVFDLKSVIDAAHAANMPVLIDEAHGAHLQTAESLPMSALQAGADVVVQSAHKMAPAFTMASYLHVSEESTVPVGIIDRYLRMLQSSSPSYLLLASLDTARKYLATRTEENMNELQQAVESLRSLLAQSDCWEVESPDGDWLKIVLLVKPDYQPRQLAAELESHGVYPELVTDRHILLVHGLESLTQDELQRLREVIAAVGSSYSKRTPVHEVRLFTQPITELAISYSEMEKMQEKFTVWQEAVGMIAAESVIPYPPGIPVLTKGEIVTKQHVEMIQLWKNSSISFQNERIAEGMLTYSK
ncbi:aminotransferase class I/II-fold pyridoxal phosphate-dependent enzyme [Terribacillus sp. DMT04]|uniref:aminotransferase class I/II-fold pyridoxal phosphate-dependent enzyme n=1 Tax=Terribacillus sp. DMT04 TaxID=2850441 RepID=UPI001C2BF0F3|nr:aminotransferase class I/II-fold pyridoxal phosphate-dependent enzyme [Terribacillus sp. DMT04]QXE01765.1 aminotransferase class I/II-fold pyridoxal phosphate-dependent enzyme [Terribacillus sp. DMT04]